MPCGALILWIMNVSPLGIFTILKSVSYLLFCSFQVKYLSQADEKSIQDKLTNQDKCLLSGHNNIQDKMTEVGQGESQSSIMPKTHGTTTTTVSISVILVIKQ